MRIIGHAYDTVDSTNDVALRLAREGAPEGTLVTARRQLKGRGRRGRAWLDSPGKSILMSLVLRPTISPDAFHELSFVVSLATAEHLCNEYGIRAMLKWPNDVLVRGMKIAGVLIEVEYSVGAAVAGVGVNMNQREFPLPLAGTATSVLIETGRECDVTRAAEGFARAILAEYERYVESGFEDIRARWLNYMWGLGERAAVHQNCGTLTGTVTGLDQKGALLLRDSAGTTHAIYSAEAVLFE